MQEVLCREAPGPPTSPQGGLPPLAPQCDRCWHGWRPGHLILKLFSHMKPFELLRALAAGSPPHQEAWGGWGLRPAPKSDHGSSKVHPQAHDS